jgi:hypothetical protein
VSVELLEKPKVEPVDTDDDVMAHIVSMPEWKVTEAIVLGLEVVALCGKRWIPHRDPVGRPVCGVCEGIAFALGWDLSAA